MANNNISSMGMQAGRQAGYMAKKANPNMYPWDVQNYKTAGQKWQNPKNYTKMLRSYASQGLQQYTENPTAYTPEMEKDVTTQYADTINAQADKANDQFKANMARTGLAGQPVAAANAAQLGYERGKDIAGKVTDTRNQFAVRRQEDFEDWLNYVRAENNQDRQFKLQRDQLAAQMAQFNAARGDRKRELGRFENKLLRWSPFAAGGLAAIGSMFGGENGGNEA